MSRNERFHADLLDNIEKLVSTVEPSYILQQPMQTHIFNKNLAVFLKVRQKINLYYSPTARMTICIIHCIILVLIFVFFYSRVCRLSIVDLYSARSKDIWISSKCASRKHCLISSSRFCKRYVRMNIMCRLTCHYRLIS